MKKLAALAVLGVLLAPPAAAQDLDEVLSNYYEAVGGIDAWTSVQSMKMTGTVAMAAMGIEAPFTVTAKRPNKVRVEYSFQGMTGTQAFDGETAWQLMPFMGQTAPEEMPESMSKDLKEQADIDGALMGWQESGHQVELLGLEETEGTQAYKLKVTLKSGDIQYYYLDAEYYIPIRVEGSREQQGQVIEYETIISDYKPVGDLMIAHSVEARAKGVPAGQVITFQQVEVNIEIDDSEFSMPETSGEGQQ
jgi:outer membrane lipoprotein-sorting protein